MGSLDLSSPEADLATIVDMSGERDRGPIWPVGPSVDVCPEYPPTHTDFIDADGDEFGELAGDFAVTLLDGSSWRFSEAWTGCDSYVFFTYFNLNESIQSASEELWASRLDELFSKGARNVRYFFMSDETSDDSRRTRLAELKERILTRLIRRFSDESDRLHWANRFHFILDRPRDIEGGIGLFFNSYLRYLTQPTSGVDLGNRGTAYPPLPNAFGIDRFQKFDAVGSLSLAVGSPSALSMASYVAGFYNHMAATVQNLAAVPPTVTVPLLEGRQTNRHFTIPIEFGADINWGDLTQIELDIQVHCPAKNPFACSEWDRIGRVELCRDQACTQVDEIARWITPYWRRGTRRWLIDISAFAPLLRAANLVIEPEMTIEPEAGDNGGDAGSAGAPSGGDATDPTGSRADSCGSDSQSLMPVDCTEFGDQNAVCVFSNHCLCSAGYVCEGTHLPGECESGVVCIPESLENQEHTPEHDAGNEGGTDGSQGSDNQNGADTSGAMEEAATGGMSGAADMSSTTDESSLPENARVFRLKMGPAWERKTERDVRVQLHFRQSPRRLPRAVIPLFRGGGFNADFDRERVSVEIDVPEDIIGAEIRYILSGHGQDGPNSCSEWCAHKHQFIVNGAPNLVEPNSPRMTSLGCAEMTKQGVVPGQWGNWNQGRAYWCPGLPVPSVAIDVLSQLRLGETNTFEHRANTVSGDLSGGNIDLSSYLVIY